MSMTLPTLKLKLKKNAIKDSSMSWKRLKIMKNGGGQQIDLEMPLWESLPRKASLRQKEGRVLL